MVLTCPRCGLSIRPRVDWLAVEHCPRCMARGHVAVDMFASTLAAEKLYAPGAAPGSRSAPVRDGDHVGDLKDTA